MPVCHTVTNICTRNKYNPQMPHTQITQCASMGEVCQYIYHIWSHWHQTCDQECPIQMMVMITFCCLFFNDLCSNVGLYVYYSRHEWGIYMHCDRHICSGAYDSDVYFTCNSVLGETVHYNELMWSIYTEIVIWYLHTNECRKYVAFEGHFCCWNIYANNMINKDAVFLADLAKWPIWYM